MHTEDGGHEVRDGHVFPLDQREEWHDEPLYTPEDAAYWPYLVISFITAVAVIGWCWLYFS